MTGLRVMATLGLTAALAACATAPVGPYRPPSPTRPPGALAPEAQAPGPAVAWSELPGWGEEDHLAAMTALSAACAASKDPALGAVCAAARARPPLDDDQARRFLEANLRPEAVSGDGVLTAYFAPEYDARQTPEPPFTAPVRPKPSALDLLLAQALAPDPAEDAPPPSAAASDSGPDRAAIEAMPAEDALAWMRPEDLFFMQIQGSGLLDFPDGRRLKAVYAGSNAKPFVGLARVMREQGLIDDSHSSGEAIRAWLADNRGPAANALMDRDPRYVFFTLRPDDGREPAGAAGVPLPPGRAVAVDRAFHALGELLWIEAEAPALTGAFPTYRRAVAALDVGGAIKGEVRADLYMGTGEAAGREAGRVRHRLRIYRLRPAFPADGSFSVAAP